MDIAALSMDMSSIAINQQVRTGILKMAMDLPKVSTEVLLDELMDMQSEMENLLLAHLGQNIDVYA